MEDHPRKEEAMCVESSAQTQQYFHCSQPTINAVWKAIQLKQTNLNARITVVGRHYPILGKNKVDRSAGFPSFKFDRNGGI
jgi:hypothetical protein